MAQYRCYFLTSEDKIFCAEDITAETEYHALEKIRGRFAELRPLPKFELWLGTTRVLSEMREAMLG